MKAIGFNLGLRGDIIMNSVAGRAFKRVSPDWHLTLGVYEKYADMLPLFYQHPYFDDFHVYSSYDGWPGQFDRAYLSNAGYNKIFNAMPPHTHDLWWKTQHQTEEVCKMHGLPVPENTQCVLNPWFYSALNKRPKTIAFNFCGAFYAGYPNSKSYSPMMAAQIVLLCKLRGYKVLVLGDPKEPEIAGAERFIGTFFDSVKTMLSCDAFIGVDSSLTWVASAYGFPTLACYNHQYYGKELIKNIQPINPQAIYLSGNGIDSISLDAIDKAIDNITA